MHFQTHKPLSTRQDKVSPHSNALIIHPSHTHLLFDSHALISRNTSRTLQGTRNHLPKTRKRKELQLPDILTLYLYHAHRTLLDVFVTALWDAQWQGNNLLLSDEKNLLLSGMPIIYFVALFSFVSCFYVQFTSICKLIPTRFLWCLRNTFSRACMFCLLSDNRISTANNILNGYVFSIYSKVLAVVFDDPE